MSPHHADGGPAFPVPNSANVNGQEGMTLRDYFAAMAMQAYINHKNGEDLGEEAIADCAYAMADAMLQERGVTP